jgi:hypothetical protein
VLTGEVTLFGFKTRAEAMKHADDIVQDVYVATIYGGNPSIEGPPIGYIIVPAQHYETQH